MTDEPQEFHLVSGDERLIRAVRSMPVNRDAIVHEYLCTACAHRDHRHCAETCAYCDVGCGCVCQRWAVSPPT